MRFKSKRISLFSLPRLKIGDKVYSCLLSHLKRFISICFSEASYWRIGPPSATLCYRIVLVWVFLSVPLYKEHRVPCPSAEPRVIVWFFMILYRPVQITDSTQQILHVQQQILIDVRGPSELPLRSWPMLSQCVVANIVTLAQHSLNIGQWSFHLSW